MMGVAMLITVSRPPLAIPNDTTANVISQVRYEIFGTK